MRSMLRGEFFLQMFGFNVFQFQHFIGKYGNLATIWVPVQSQWKGLGLVSSMRRTLRNGTVCKCLMCFRQKSSPLTAFENPCEWPICKIVH